MENASEQLVPLLFALATAANHNLLVVECDVWKPHFLRRRNERLDSCILAAVPRQAKVPPILQYSGEIKRGKVRKIDWRLLVNELCAISSLNGLARMVCRHSAEIPAMAIHIGLRSAAD